MKSSKDDPAISELKKLDEVIGKTEPIGPVAADLATPGAPAAPPDNQFLKQAAGQIVSQFVEISKLAVTRLGAEYVSPASATGLSDDQWKAAVSETTVAVIQKRWPSLADSATPEFALAVLVLPWALLNFAPILLKVVFRGKSDRDTRRDGDGKNNSHAKTPGPVPEGVSDRSDQRQEVQ